MTNQRQIEAERLRLHVALGFLGGGILLPMLQFPTPQTQATQANIATSLDAYAAQMRDMMGMRTWPSVAQNKPASPTITKGWSQSYLNALIDVEMGI